MGVSLSQPARPYLKPIPLVIPIISFIKFPPLIRNRALEGPAHPHSNPPFLLPGWVLPNNSAAPAVASYELCRRLRTALDKPSFSPNA